MGTGPRRRAGLRPRADRAARRRAPVPRRGRQPERGAEVLAELSSRPADGGRPRRRGRGRRPAPPRAHGPHARQPPTCASCSRATSSTRAGTRSPSAASPAATARIVCPTCFCSSVEDTTDLTGEEAERTRVWDSCFSLDYSYIHGGSVRPSARSRYRQWLTHKLGTWHDQFGTSGCVGCGRCITWCPVGIDITEELAAIRGRGDGRCRRQLDEILARGAVLRGHGRGRARADRRLRRATSTSTPARRSSGEGDPADNFYVVRHGTRRARDLRARRAARS